MMLLPISIDWSGNGFQVISDIFKEFTGGVNDVLSIFNNALEQIKNTITLISNFLSPYINSFDFLYTIILMITASVGFILIDLIRDLL